MSSSVFPATQIINFPAGMIMPYAGAAIPEGWLECNGAEIDIAAYPTLAAALGSTWNTAKNPLTGANHSAPASGKFRVPDMRGAFLRGSTGGANNAQGVATALAEFQAHKTAKNGLGVGNSAVTSGTVSSDHFHGTGNSGSHDHSTNTGFQVYGGGGGTGMTFGGSYTGPNQYNPRTDIAGNHNHGNTGGISANHTHTTTTAVTLGNGDAETRPDAVGVRYLIKA